MVTVRNRGGKGFLISRSRLRGPFRRDSCPLVERNLAGFAKYLPRRRWQRWSQKGTQTLSGSSV